MARIYRLLIVFSLLFLMPIQGVAGKPSPHNPEVDKIGALNEPLCYEMDVVFLIDQSGSMSGESGNPPNDPLGNRFEAPRYALDWLANNRLGLCSKAVHRIGVISFGGDSVVDLPLTPIEPGNQDDWKAIYPGLKEKIAKRSMGATDPLKAFQMAKDMLEQNPPPGNTLRKRVIILLTDGQPCVTGMGCSFDADDPVNQRYMDGLVKFINDNFQFSDRLKAQDAAFDNSLLTYGSFDAIPHDILSRIFTDNPVSAEETIGSTYLYIVAMNTSTPYLKVVEKRFTEVTEERDGKLIDLKNNKTDVPRVFSEIMSRLGGVTPNISGCGPLPVNPYLSGAVLDIFKPAEGLDVQIKFDGKVITRGTGDTEFFGMTDFNAYGAVEHYRFVQPPAGIWEIVAADCSENGIRAAFIPFKSKISQLEPSTVVPNYDAEGAAFDPNHKHFLLYEITDQETSSKLNLNPDYPLDLKATITGPDGSQVVQNMTFVANGQWISAEPIPVNQKGEYKVSVVGLAQCLNASGSTSKCSGDQFEVVRDDSGSYITGNVDPFKIVILQPADKGNVPLHGKLIPDGLKVQPVQIELQMLDKNDQPVAVESMLKGDLSSTLEINLSVGEETRPAMVYVDPRDPTKMAGVVMGPEEEGENTLSVNILKDGYDYTKVRPSNLPQVTKFTRKDPWLQDPDFWKAVSWLIGLILAGFVGKIIYDFTNPLRGNLQFAAGAACLTLALYTGKRKSVIKKPEVLTALKLKKVKAKRINDNAGRAQIRVTFYPKTGSPKDVDITDGMGAVEFQGFMVTYSGGGIARRQPPARPQMHPRQPGRR